MLRGLDALIPSSLRSRGEPAAIDETRRARILVGSALGGGVVCAVFSVHRALAEGPGPKLWVMMASAVAFVLPLLVLRAGGSLRTAATIIPSALAILVPYDAYNNGGLATASLTAMLPIPMIAGFFLGRRASALFAAVLVAEILVLCALTASGHRFPSALAPEDARWTGAVAVLGLVPFVAVLTALFDRQQEIALARLSASEQRYAIVARETNDGMFDWDLASDEVTLSARYRELLGASAQASLSFAAFLGELHPADATVLAASLASLREGGDDLRAEYRLRTGSGEYVWVEGRAHALVEGGAARRVLGTIRDATARKRLDQLKDEFVSTVSHELRTPLTCIRGSLGLLHGGVAGALPAQALDLLEVAKQNSERLVRIVDDLLDVQKLEAGLLELSPTDVDLRDVMRASVDANASYAAKLGVSLALDLPDAAVRAAVDVERFMQVLANLLSNALKFSPAGSAVVARVRLDGARARVEVVDAGPGIPQEFQRRIFQKFAQADASDDRANKGTGLGLSIAKSLVERMGGEIGFRSAPGATTFWIALDPIAPRPSASAAPDVEPPAASRVAKPRPAPRPPDEERRRP